MTAPSAAVPPLGWVLAASLLARLPLVMMGLALVLLVRDIGHPYWAVGIISGSFVLATAAASPLLGRLADRIGATPVLLGSSLISAGGLATLAAIPDRLGIAGLALVAALTGTAEPPVSAVLRALLPRLAQGDDLRAAYTLEAALQEILFVAGPPVVVGIVAFSSPRAAVGLCAGLVLAATAWFAVTVRPHLAPGRPRAAIRALASVDLRLLVVAFALIGITFGAIDIATVASMDEHGHRDLAGLALGAWAIGSLAAGMVVTRRRRKPPAQRLPWLLTAMGLLTLPLILAQRDPLLLGAALFAQGTLIAPSLGTVFELIPSVVAEDVLTEAFAWTSSFILAGFAGGAAAAGALVGWEARRPDSRSPPSRRSSRSSPPGRLLGATSGPPSCETRPRRGSITNGVFCS